MPVSVYVMLVSVYVMSVVNVMSVSVYVKVGSMKVSVSKTGGNTGSCTATSGNRVWISPSGRIPWSTSILWIFMSPVIACRIVSGSNGSCPSGGGPGYSGPNGGINSGYSVPNGISFGSSGSSGIPFSVKSGFVSTLMLIFTLGL